MYFFVLSSVNPCAFKRVGLNKKISDNVSNSLSKRKCIFIVIMICICLCACVLIVRPGLRSVKVPSGLVRRQFAVAGCLMVMALLFQKAGFAITTALVSLFFARLFSLSWRTAIAWAVLLGVGGYLLFAFVFDLNMPVGDWWMV